MSCFFRKGRVETPPAPEDRHSPRAGPLIQEPTSLATCVTFWTGDFCEISGPCGWCFLVLRRIVTFSGFRQKMVQPEGTSCQSSVSSEKCHLSVQSVTFLHPNTNDGWNRCFFKSLRLRVTKGERSTKAGGLI